MAQFTEFVNRRTIAVVYYCCNTNGSVQHFPSEKWWQSSHVRSSSIRFFSSSSPFWFGVDLVSDRPRAHSSGDGMDAGYGVNRLQCIQRFWVDEVVSRQPAPTGFLNNNIPLMVLLLLCYTHKLLNHLVFKNRTRRDRVGYISLDITLWLCVCVCALPEERW